jgi:hypothetical protein
VTKLNDKNYLGWVYNVKQILQRHKVWKIVNGEETAPMVDDKVGSSKAESSKGKIASDPMETWNDRKELALHIISSTIEDRQQLPIRSTEDPKEAWDILNRLHASKGFQRKQNLLEKLNSLRKSPTTTLDDHETDFRSILEELSAAGKFLDANDLIIQYL